MLEIEAHIRSLQTGDIIDPEVVVRDAQDPTSPIHHLFDWDDKTAAHSFRLGQARQLIRRIRFETTVRDIPISGVRYVRDPDSSGYRDITTFTNQADNARRVVLDEMDRVSKAAKRAKAVAAILGTADDVTNIIALAQQVARAAEIKPDDQQPGGDQPSGNA